MNITIEQQHNAITVFLAGEMDALGCGAIRPQFESLVSDHSQHAVTLNLDKVSFIDSSGIGAIVFLFKRLRATGRDLEVCCVHGQPRELMELLRINSAIKVHWEIQTSHQVAAQS